MNDKGETRSTGRNGRRDVDAAAEPTRSPSLDADLHERDERLQAMFGQAAVGILLCSTNGDILEVNPRICEILGRTEKNLLKETCETLTHPEDWACNQLMMREVGEGERADFVIEKRYKHANGDWRWVNVSVSPLLDAEGRVHRLLAVVQDVDARKRADEELLRVSALNRAMTDSIGEGLFTVDAEGRVRAMNPEAERLFGWTSAELVGRSIHETTHFQHPDGRVFHEDDCQLINVLKTGKSIRDVDDTFIRKDGTFFPVRYTSSPMLGSSGEVEGLVVVFRDVSERRDEEKRLALLAAVGERIRQETDAGVLLYDVSVLVGKHFNARRCLFNEIYQDNDLEIVHRDYADGVEQVAGRHKLSAYSAVTTAEMAAGRTVVNIDSKKDPRTSRRYKKTYEPAGERAYVSVPLMREGRWVASLWVSTDQPRSWSAVEVGLLEMIAERSWLAVERLRHEQEMRLSEARFAGFMANLPGLAWIKDTDGRYIFANESAIGAFNAPGGRLFGKTDADVFPPETAEEFYRNDLKVVRTRKPLQTVESMEGEDGKPRYSIVNKFPIPGSDGKTALIGGMAIDITEQRRAEDEVRLISRMPAENPHPVMRISADGDILYANDAAKPLFDFWKRESGHEVPREMLMRVHESFRVGMRQDLEIEFDGRTVFATIAPVVEGGYVNVYGVDITDRKRAEEALRQKERELQLIADTTPLILTRCSRDQRYQFINQAGADVLGLRVKEVVGRRMVDVMGKEAYAVIEPYVRQVLAGEHVEFEVELPFSAGPRWMRVSYVPEFDGDGTVSGWIGSIADVTDLRLAQQGTARLAAIVEFSEDAIISKDTNGIITSWNRGAQNVFGYTADETVGRPVTILIPPDRIDEEPGILERIRRGESIEHYETIRQRKDGTRIAISLTVSPIRDANGNVVGASKVARDITEKKLAEERLRVSQNQLRLITDGLPALISYVNREERYVYANRTYFEWFGVEPSTVIGRTVKSVFGLSAYRKVKPHTDRALAGEEAQFEGLIPYKKGGARYVVGTYVPDIGADGEVRGYFGLTNDMTDLQRSRELLRMSEERLSLLMETFTDYAIISLDRNGRVESWNTGAEYIFGYTRDEMMGQTCDRIFTPEDVAANVPLKEMRSARQRGRAQDERWHMRKDGTRFFASGVMMPLYVGRNLTGYAKIASDLTEKQRQAELLQKAHDELEARVAIRTRELAESNSALLQEIAQRAAAEKQRIDLLRRLVSSQEFERRRIARDLHDQLGQRLTALRLKIASLKEVSAGSPFAERVERLQEIGERLDTEVSFLAWELRPSALDDLGLIDALSAYVNEWSRHYETAAAFHASGVTNDDFDREAETHLYRITQESLNNIAKYAQATEVSVLLENMAGSVVLIIEDNGTGFDPAKVEPPSESGHGLGLIGMRERAALIGGEFEIESRPGAGTTIYVKVPIAESEDESE